MNKRQLQKIKSTLTKAVESHLKKGGTLLAGDFYLGGGKCNLANDKVVAACKCPVQIVTDNITRTAKEQRPSTSDDLSKALGFKITRDEMFAVISGYDKRSKIDMGQWASVLPNNYEELYAIGRELRKNYKPLTKSQINKIMGYDYV